ncbi:MAG: Bug family tripartite tricarboxylate transporter substrate binding protein, partial [Betaproteobacteria bacterium]
MTSASTRAPRLLALAALACLAGGALAQQPGGYPTKPIQLIAQQPPGSGSDAMTRVWADCAARELGQAVVVQNKPGANGILAINYLKSQPADGYSLLSIGMSQMTITPYVYKQPPYDPQHDFDGVAVLGTSPLVLAVPPGMGIASLADLQKLARSTPGGINFGSPGKGSPAHLLTSALVDKLGVPGTHVPFVGEGAGLTALMGQQIHAMTLVIGTAAAQVKAGKLVPLALFGAQRSALLPDV